MKDANPPPANPLVDKIGLAGVNGTTMKLDVYYDGETDTLSLWNGKPASAGADVAENLTADLDADGEVVGFTLEHAAEMLKAIIAHRDDVETLGKTR